MTHGKFSTTNKTQTHLRACNITIISVHISQLIFPLKNVFQHCHSLWLWIFWFTVFHCDFLLKLCTNFLLSLKESFCLVLKATFTRRDVTVVRRDNVLQVNTYGHCNYRTCFVIVRGRTRHHFEFKVDTKALRWTVLSMIYTGRWCIDVCVFLPLATVIGWKNLQLLTVGSM